MTTIEVIALGGAVLAVIASLVVAAIAWAQARSLRERLAGMGHIDALLQLDGQLLAKRAQVAEQEERLLRERERLLGQDVASVSAKADARGELTWALGRFADATSASLDRLHEGTQGSLRLLQGLAETQAGTAHQTQALLQQLPVLINELASEQKRLGEILSSCEPAPPSLAPHALRAGPVSVSALCPSTVRKAEAFVLDIWAYPSHSFRQVQERAASLERSRHAGAKDGLRLRLESYISVKICLPTLIVREPVDGFHWVAEPANASYEVFVPEDASLGTHSGLAELFCDGLKVGKLHFAVNATDRGCLDARMADTTLEAKIISVPIESADAAPPPTELSTLHFNDAYALYLTLAKSQDVESSGAEPLAPR